MSLLNRGHLGVTFPCGFCGIFVTLGHIHFGGGGYLQFSCYES